MHVGRVMSMGLLGLAFGFFLGVDLVLFGVVALNSIVVTILMVAGLVAGGVLGWLVAERRAHEPPVA